MQTKFQVAETILRQLGGNEFVAMTGAYSLSAGPNALGFRLPRCKNGIGGVYIELTPLDLYKVRFVASKGINVYTHSEYDMISCDQLQELFTEETGLYCTLFPAA